eukprot:CAMPEP_0175098232 /NCGR_PEP_ID=MMETSP0086_2-20121207/5735_1 /TAXON_ID=136419 /ORGANISM="Unknown Unknown, Strain D1" /LENGTH=160 /DNA_ID=CAMNT_0016371845 /DNA_START=116 /DNA_END=598 /DNA_ORIENTATION=+
MITVEECIAMKPARLVISPGPGAPKDAGISKDCIKAFAGKIPILGICLGHQSIFELYGGNIVSAPSIMHGKVSPVNHKEEDLFKGCRPNLLATRYHSLVGDPNTLPDCLQVTATTDDIIQAVRHKEYVMCGVQFHPESVTTEDGKIMLANFLAMEGGTWA